ncbi:MAG: heavy-metal-associated domain-containing protein [Prolixibacteraceae bacterium]|jgi:copper chaperone|nr:heavy-metal-associated domain-containing protein [Prolixibacteraceae bacterium]MBT6005096.1 heavy-metal-associated domain-containing protein [Prolixibacteraceae bacterium]MBT6763849.1 heavy-metal-associated domain-containing protein [Prolixibacteraceae bacterium]MBT7000485.1 heavy-metal-associated domain-containing protein [Prolixibacteraceae bacterium]MBT7393644.1 heavy-metal-associated domain-containing protein [Prolixibacteraceae bacterium]
MKKLFYVFIILIFVSCNTGSKNTNPDKATTESAEVVETTLNISGMHCDMCVASIEKGINELAGIEHVKASLSDSTAVVKFDAAKTNLAEIEKAIVKRGYKIKSDLQEF